MLEFAAARIQRCTDAGIFHQDTNAEVAMHLIWGALTGPAVIGSGCRLAPGEDPDALARDILEVVIAGLKAGSATTFKPCTPPPSASSFIHAVPPPGVRSHES
jgi:hypothetical protein